MSTDRRFEYDKGPSLEDEEPADSDPNAHDEPPEPDESGRATIDVAPWKGGAVAGTSAFTVMVAAFYQLVSGFTAMGGYGGSDGGPGAIVMTSLSASANHGVRILQDGEPIDEFLTLRMGFVPSVTGLVPAVVLAVAGYLLVRYVRLETRRAAGLAVGTLVASYVVLLTGLTTIAEWTPDGEAATADAPTIAAATDLGTVVTIGTTTVAFVAVGAAVAAVPRLAGTTR
ncbi:hypothetical protein [Natrinema versiforme]|uniref:Uncharacterized protein n=1 Tax=Natrinema versiforme JCM 10478 TaxID=1227496 RepID=L9XYR2_9EURY|nr:hypothetical protein [Natrinema versiforme]ELY65743.1 hypothetical protein C489_14275 [Natrinema versiforme JCM 10478]